MAFPTKLKRYLTFAIEISKHNANTAFFAILVRKRLNNFLKKADIYQYYDQNGTLSVILRINRSFNQKKF